VASLRFLAQRTAALSQNNGRTEQRWVYLGLEELLNAARHRTVQNENRK